MARASILEYLDNFRLHASEPAYVFRRGYRVQRWSYGEVLGTPIALPGRWKSRGISKGDKVLIWGENCAEWVVAFFGCLLRGAIVVPIDKISDTGLCGASSPAGGCEVMRRSLASCSAGRGAL